MFPCGWNWNGEKEMAKGVLRQASVFGKVFKYRIKELETEFRLPSGEALTFTNWDVKGVRERFYREEFLDPEIHYNQPKETEPSEFGLTASDVKSFIESKPDTFDPLPELVPELMEPKGAHCIELGAMPLCVESIYRTPKIPATPEPISVSGIAPDPTMVPELVPELSEAHSA